MSENVNRLLLPKAVPIIELRLAQGFELDRRVRDALREHGIDGPVRYEQYSVSDFLKKFMPTEVPDENGETNVSAMLGAGVVIVISLTLGTVLAFIFL